LWIEAALALALALGIGALATLEGFAGGTLLSLLVALFFGLEAPTLYLAALRRRGWREVGLVEADSAADAETRYLAETVAQPAVPAGRETRRPAEPIASSVPPGGRGQTPGLLFNPGRS